MNRRNKKILELDVHSDYSNLEFIREKVFTTALSVGFDEDNAYLISLAVDEACTNLIKYAYNFDTGKRIEITAEMTSDKEFSVFIYDTGTPFNSLEAPLPDMNVYFNEYKQGGLGIYIMRQIMDIIKYNPSHGSQKKNQLVLTKYLSHKF